MQRQQRTNMKGTQLLLCMWLIAFGAHSCMIETVPLPEMRDKNAHAAPGDEGSSETTPDASDSWPPPSDIAPEGSFAYDASYLFYSLEPATLVGVEYAVSPGSRIFATNTGRNWTGAIDAASNGSFNMPLNAQAEDTLELAVVDEQDGEEIVYVDTLVLFAPANSILEANQILAELLQDCCTEPMPEDQIAVLPPDADGNVTVAAPQDSLPADLTVVVANVSMGNATSAMVESNGGFEAILSGNSEDVLSIFVVDVSDVPGGVHPIEVVVP